MVQKHSKLTSVILGVAYVLLVGFGSFGNNLGTSLFSLIFLTSLLLLSNNRQLKFSLWERSLFTGCAVIILFIGISTNWIVVYLNEFAFLFISSLLVLKNYNGKVPFTVTAYVSGLARCLKSISFAAVSPSNLSSYFFHIGSQVREGSKRIERDHIKGIMIAIPILLIFHILFSLINSDYSHFMFELAKRIWDVIEYLIKIEIIWTTIKVAVSSYIIHLILSVSSEQADILASSETKQDKTVRVVLSLTVILFAIFSSFQVKFLGLNLSNLPFKELSLYTQRGFWELIVVSILGYTLATIAISRLNKDEPKKTELLKNLLYVFLVELLLISVFSYHKIYFLQLFFGLKDQRIIATVGITLVLITILLLFRRIILRSDSKIIFKVQSVLFVISIVTINMVNVDLVSSTFHPTNYYVDSVKQIDYGYILNNSFDNYSIWTKAIKDAKATEMKYPREEYYWGRYEPLCTVDYISNKELVVLRSTSTYPTSLASSILEDRVDNLMEAYGKPANDMKTWFEDVRYFNLNEYQSYLVVKNDKQLFDDFIEYTKRECVRDYVERSI